MVVAMAIDDRPVTRRRVFYMPGYDPFPARRYRELYRREGAAQAAFSGYEIMVRTDGERDGWRVAARIEGAAIDTRVRVLVWSDIVRSSMRGGVARTYAAMVRTVWAYVRTGAFGRVMRLRKGPVIAALYPVAMLSLQLALAVVVAGIGAILGGWIGLFLGLAAGTLLLRWFHAKDRHLYAYYLMRNFAYSASANGAIPEGLSQRLAMFGDEIAAAIEEDVDEVLVVGHSSGAHHAITILADLLRAERIPLAAPAVSLLTLGQVIPMVSFLPDAHRLRADLHLMAKQDRIAWVDVTAPGDGCAFALCDPVAVSGVSPPAPIWPLVLSAAFTRTLRSRTWRRLRWRFFRLHFQYLCAFDALSGRPGEYDYFRITAGPLTLGGRMGRRPPSRSRLDRPVSRHRSMAA